RRIYPLGGGCFTALPGLLLVKSGDEKRLRANLRRTLPGPLAFCRNRNLPGRRPLSGSGIRRRHQSAPKEWRQYAFGCSGCEQKIGRANGRISEETISKRQGSIGDSRTRARHLDGWPFQIRLSVAGS